MDALLDVQGDLAAVADAMTPVTLRRRDGSPPAVTLTAFRRAISTREAAASNGRYTESDARWHLPAEQLAAPPAIGDRIIDEAGGAWTILELRLATCGSRYECVTRNLAISCRLTERVTIRRESIHQDASGAVERDWIDVQTNIVARIEEVATQRGGDLGRQAGTVTARIFVEEPIDVDGGYRVVANDGRVFEVVGHETPESIDKLFVIHALRRL